MRKFIIPLVTGVIVAMLILPGCAKPAPEAPAPEAPAPEAPAPEAPAPEEWTLPPEPAGFPQPNPYWGLGFKPDGTPYKFAVIMCEIVSGYLYVLEYDVGRTQLAMSGADVTGYAGSGKLDYQVAIIEDLISEDIDGIQLYPCDTAGTGPVVDKAGQAGIPVFNMDVPTDSENSIFCCRYDNYARGVYAGEVAVRIAEELGKDLYFHELWCPMTLEVCANRSYGFRDAIAGHPNVTVVMQTPYGGDEGTMNAIMDAFPANPQLNALYTNGNMFFGATEGLQQLDRYFPIGHPEHVVWIAQDDGPVSDDNIRDGYEDCALPNSGWAMADATAKAVLTYVCLGQPVPKVLLLPGDEVTRDNIDISPYGGPMRWGDMLEYEPDATKWPILDMAQYGMPTPTYAGK